MIKLLVLYNVFVLTILTFVGFMDAQTIPQILSSILFFPLAAYFWRMIMPSTRHALPQAEVEAQPISPIIHKKKASLPSAGKKKATAILQPEGILPGTVDANRRMFLRLIGSAGVSVFLLSIFTGKADAAFFGSVPGPGTVGVKDSSGTLIDPSEKLPTDGYNITQVDDSIPAYYGYVEKNGAWYIIKEDSSGAYRYAKGASSFSTNWTGRALLTYDYFNAVF